MLARRSASLIIPVAAVAALLLVPAASFAGGTTESLSAVDSIAADVSVDGTNDSKPATQTDANDSPTKDTYGTGTDSVPPPVTCGSTTTTDSSSKPAVDTSTSKPATDTCTIVECSSADTDGKDASGKPCTVTETKTETPCTEGGGSGGTVCGGGGVEEPVEQPLVSEPVAGGGDPLPEPVEVAGGGGPELPFTGLPLWYAIYGGIALMLAGAALWMRGRFGSKGA
jgi:hypothetical protein